MKPRQNYAPLTDVDLGIWAWRIGMARRAAGSQADHRDAEFMLMLQRGNHVLDANGRLVSRNGIAETAPLTAEDAAIRARVWMRNDALWYVLMCSHLYGDNQDRRDYAVMLEAQRMPRGSC